MKYVKPTTGTQGAWVKASELSGGERAMLVSEAAPMESEYGTQDVAKIRIEGKEDTMNVRINKPTIAGLIEAFGDDSKNWIKKELTIHTEKMNVGGRRVTALYLIPEGFELAEDAGGYLVITKTGGKDDEIPVIEKEDDIDVADIPF